MAYEKKRPLIIFSITNGWGIRNFYHTGLLKKVSEFSDIGIATSPNLLSFFTTLKDNKNISFVFELPHQELIYCQKIRQLKKAILQAKFNISTAKIKWLSRGNNKASKFILHILWNIQRLLAAHWQLKVLELLENKLCIYKPPKDIPLPDLLVNCDPFYFRDNSLQRALSNLGIASMAIIPSWDNPSTKGCISTNVESILVWGEIQKKEILKYYPQINSQRVHISGIPQFDAYYQQLPQKFDRKSFFESLSINPDHKVILYATCPPRLFPTEHEVIFDLADAVINNYFGDDVHLLIRCHPADSGERYQDLLSYSKRVTIYMSSLKNAASQNNEISNNILGSMIRSRVPLVWNEFWTPPEDEIFILAATLRHSNVCINTASTMTLDACASKIPVINIAYNGRNNPPYLNSVSRFYDYHHYLPVVNSGAASIVTSCQEMLFAVKDALTTPEKFDSERNEIVKKYCFHPDTGSTEYIATKIKESLLGSSKIL